MGGLSPQAAAAQSARSVAQTNAISSQNQSFGGGQYTLIGGGTFQTPSGGNVAQANISSQYGVENKNPNVTPIATYDPTKPANAAVNRAYEIQQQQQQQANFEASNAAKQAGGLSVHTSGILGTTQASIVTDTSGNKALQTKDPITGKTTTIEGLPQSFIDSYQGALISAGKTDNPDKYLQDWLSTNYKGITNIDNVLKYGSNLSPADQSAQQQQIINNLQNNFKDELVTVNKLDTAQQQKQQLDNWSQQQGFKDFADFSNQTGILPNGGISKNISLSESVGVSAGVQPPISIPPLSGLLDPNSVAANNAYRAILGSTDKGAVVGGTSNGLVNVYTPISGGTPFTISGTTLTDPNAVAANKAYNAISGTVGTPFTISGTTLTDPNAVAASKVLSSILGIDSSGKSTTGKIDLNPVINTLGSDYGVSQSYVNSLLSNQKNPFSLPAISANDVNTYSGLVNTLQQNVSKNQANILSIEDQQKKIQELFDATNKIYAQKGAAAAASGGNLNWYEGEAFANQINAYNKQLGILNSELSAEQQSLINNQNALKDTTSTLTGLTSLRQAQRQGVQSSLESERTSILSSALPSWQSTFDLRYVNTARTNDYITPILGYVEPSDLSTITGLGNLQQQRNAQSDLVARNIETLSSANAAFGAGLIPNAYGEVEQNNRNKNINLSESLGITTGERTPAPSRPTLMYRTLSQPMGSSVGTSKLNNYFVKTPSPIVEPRSNAGDFLTRGSLAETNALASEADRASRYYGSTPPNYGGLPIFTTGGTVPTQIGGIETAQSLGRNQGWSALTSNQFTAGQPLEATTLASEAARANQYYNIPPLLVGLAGQRAIPNPNGKGFIYIPETGTSPFPSVTSTSPKITSPFGKTTTPRNYGVNISESLGLGEGVGSVSPSSVTSTSNVPTVSGGVLTTGGYAALGAETIQIPTMADLQKISLGTIDDKSYNQLRDTVTGLINSPINSFPMVDQNGKLVGTLQRSPNLAKDLIALENQYFVDNPSANELTLSVSERGLLPPKTITEIPSLSSSQLLEIGNIASDAKARGDTNLVVTGINQGYPVKVNIPVNANTQDQLQQLLLSAPDVNFKISSINNNAISQYQAQNALLNNDIANAVKGGITSFEILNDKNQVVGKIPSSEIKSALSALETSGAEYSLNPVNDNLRAATKQANIENEASIKKNISDAMKSGATTLDINYQTPFTSPDQIAPILTSKTVPINQAFGEIMKAERSGNVVSYGITQPKQIPVHRSLATYANLVDLGQAKIENPHDQAEYYASRAITTLAEPLTQITNLASPYISKAVGVENPLPTFMTPAPSFYSNLQSFIPAGSKALGNPDLSYDTRTPSEIFTQGLQSAGKEITTEPLKVLTETPSAIGSTYLTLLGGSAITRGAIGGIEQAGAYVERARARGPIMKYVGPLTEQVPVTQRMARDLATQESQIRKLNTDIARLQTAKENLLTATPLETSTELIQNPNYSLMTKNPLEITGKIEPAIQSKSDLLKTQNAYDNQIRNIEIQRDIASQNAKNIRDQIRSVTTTTVPTSDVTANIERTISNRLFSPNAGSIKTDEFGNIIPEANPVRFGGIGPQVSNLVPSIPVTPVLPPVIPTEPVIRPVTEGITPLGNRMYGLDIASLTEASTALPKGTPEKSFTRLLDITASVPRRGEITTDVWMQEALTPQEIRAVENTPTPQENAVVGKIIKELRSGNNDVYSLNQIANTEFERVTGGKIAVEDIAIPRAELLRSVAAKGRSLNPYANDPLYTKAKAIYDASIQTVPFENFKALELTRTKLDEIKEYDPTLFQRVALGEISPAVLGRVATGTVAKVQLSAKFLTPDTAQRLTTIYDLSAKGEPTIRQGTQRISGFNYLTGQREEAITRAAQESAQAGRKRSNLPFEFPKERELTGKELRDIQQRGYQYTVQEAMTKPNTEPLTPAEKEAFTNIIRTNTSRGTASNVKYTPPRNLYGLATGGQYFGTGNYQYPTPTLFTVRNEKDAIKSIKGIYEKQIALGYQPKTENITAKSRRKARPEDQPYSFDFGQIAVQRQKPTQTEKLSDVVKGLGSTKTKGVNVNDLIFDLHNRHNQRNRDKNDLTQLWNPISGLKEKQTPFQDIKLASFQINSQITDTYQGQKQPQIYDYQMRQDEITKQTQDYWQLQEQLTVRRPPEPPFEIPPRGRGFPFNYPAGLGGYEEPQTYKGGRKYEAFAVALEPFGPSGGLLGEYTVTAQPNDKFFKKAFKWANQPNVSAEDFGW